MAESSIGVKLQYSTDAGSTWTTAGCILSLDSGGIKVDSKESTCLSQTNKWKTFFPTFIDAGEFTAELDWVRTDYLTLFNQLGDDPIDWRIVVPDGSDLSDPTTCTRLAGDGFITNLGLAFATDGDRVKFPITIKLSGELTLTLAS